MPRIWSIQYLRAAAALMVVLFHAQGMAGEYFGAQGPAFGAAGVDIFFVISGFIMWTTTSSESVTPASFVKHRIVRIVPLYWAITLFLYAGWLIARGHVATPPIADLVRSLLFIPYVSARSGEIQPLLIAGWTLNFEMFFYAVFACALLLARRHRAVLVGAVLLGFVALRAFVSPATAIALTYTSPLLIEFVLGCMLGILYERKSLPAPVMAVLIIALGSALMTATDALSAADIGFDRFIGWGVPAFLIVAGALGLEPFIRHWRLPALLGDASYSIYLSHSLTLATLKNGVLIAGGASSTMAIAAYLSIGCFVGATAGIAIYYLVEMPLTGFFRARLFKPLASKSVPLRPVTERPPI